MDSQSLRVFPVDIKSDMYYVSIVATRFTKTPEVVRFSLEKLQIYEDPSLYDLYIGLMDETKSWSLLHEDDNPVTLLDNSFLHEGAENRMILCKRANSSVLLSTVTSGVSITMETSDVEDLCKLEDLSEDSMLSILQTRFEQNCIYTYVGSILIAINPYYLYSIYNPKYSTRYQNRHLGELPPHIFAIADDAYNSMLTEKCNQAVIISGESGAGKTESTKFLLHQLMKLSAKFEETSSLELITLGTGPVLEAFGNAKTIANNNSSRFGKFILVKFKENGAYYGSSIEKYLLEKSRIISQAPGERNYHVFYYLLNGANPALKTKLHLLPPDQYHYLGQHTIVTLESVDEIAEFHRLRESLTMLGFVPELQNRMFTILSAILHIGNIEFEKNDPDETVHVSNMPTIHIISELLNVHKDTLCNALTTRKSKAGGTDSFVTPYKMDEAVATRDALAKALYGALFDWIVEKVNDSLTAGQIKGPHKGNTIGVLDIFGFEVFQKNSFEQFCINYANEQLQQYFNKHIFKLEQVEYDLEGIEWQSVVFVDNADCLDLIAKKPTGLLPLLDEECSFPGADDSSLFQKFERQHKSHPYFSAPQMKQREPVFTISHYASHVTYSIQGFREKNRDLMRQDVIDVLATSKMDLVRALIGLPPYAVHRWHTAILSVMAAIWFRKSGEKQKEKREEEWMLSNPNVVTCEVKTSPTSFESSGPDPIRTGTPDAPILVPGKGNSKGSSEAFAFEYGAPLRTRLGLRLTKVYEISGRDSPDDDEHCTSQRHPSIANLLKRKLQRTVRSRVDGEKGKDGDEGRETFSKYSFASKRTDSSRSLSLTTSGKPQPLSINPNTNRRGQSKTVSAQFHTSLVTLMEQLENTHPYFVRCIKSNKEKAPRKFDTDLVTRQLRYTGMMETIRIRKSGFAVRMSFEDFYEKYEFLIGRRKSDLANQIQEFLESLGFSNNDIQIGKTKVFMRNSQKRVLQDLLQEKVLTKIVLIQRWIRAKLNRCRFLHMRRSAIVIQAAVRGCLARRHYVIIHKRLCAAVVIQSAWRGFLCRRDFLTIRGAAVVIQSTWKGIITRRQYVILLEEERKRLQDEEEKRKILEERRIKELKLLEEQKKVEEEAKKLISQKDQSLLNGSEESDILYTNDKGSGNIESIWDPPKTRIGSMVDEVNAMLMEFDLMLAGIEPDKTAPTIQFESQSEGVINTDNSTLSINTDEEARLISPDLIDRFSLSSDTSPTPSPENLHVPTIKHSRSSLSSDTTPLENSPTSQNVKKLIAQMQHRSTSPSPTPLSPHLSSNTSSPHNLHNRVSLRFSENGGTQDHEERKFSLPVGRIKSPFLDNKTGPSTSKKPSAKSYDSQLTVVDNASHTNESHDSHVIKQDQISKNDEPSVSDRLKTAPLVQKKPVRKRPLQRAGGPMERKVISRKLYPVATPLTDQLKEVGVSDGKQNDEIDDILPDDLSDEELDVPLPNEDHQSRTSLPSHTQSMHVHNPRNQSHSSTSKHRREIRSVGDTYELDEESNYEILDESHLQSTELTEGMSPDALYHLNYQMRHSTHYGSSDSTGRSGEDSPVGEKERFVVNKKRWGIKSPVKSLKGIKDSSHPLISKIQRIGSPMSSGESGSSTPVLGHSPTKMLKSRSKTDLPIFQHTFKTSFVGRGHICVVCNKGFSGFLKNGSKCVCCGFIVHKQCQDKAPLCQNQYEPGRHITMASEKVVSKLDDLDELAQFLVEKHHLCTHQMSLLAEKDMRQVDRVFQMALCEFHANLVSNYSLSLQDTPQFDTSSYSTSKEISLSFEQLVNKFNSIYRSMARREELLLDSCDIAIGVNQIRTFLDEFVKSRQQRVRSRTLSNEEKSRPKLTRRRKSLDKDFNIKVHKSHRFTLTQFNVVIVCDQCSRPIPVLEKGEVCAECNYSCHESCVKKVSLKCEGKSRSRGGTEKTETHSQSHVKSQFGVQLQQLFPRNEAKIPFVLEKCFECIESHGLYTQGIYRRSAGGSSKRAVREALEADPKGADLENFSLHAVAATVTSFFRELPHPLLTKELYMDFIRASDISDAEEMLETLHQIIETLPDLNHCVFERLVFHLARVAQQESVNKMGPHNLAIIFAPTLLQGEKDKNPQELLMVMPKQTIVLEMIITEQVDKLTATIRGIHTLTSVARTAATRLSKLIAEEGKDKQTTKLTDHLVSVDDKKEKIKGDMEGINEGVPEEDATENIGIKIDEEKRLLAFELRHLNKERAVLTASLPKLEPFSPMETLSFNLSSTSIYDNNLHKKPPRDKHDIRGTGKEEFLKRQSMFNRGTTPSEDQNLKRYSYDLERKKEPKGSEVFVNENSIEDTLPDLPPVEILQPLTKNRITKPALAKRRKPTTQHVRNQSSKSDLWTSDVLFESPL